MKTILIEDEKAAIRNLTALLTEVAPQIEITTTLDSITESIAWLRTNPIPDVIFMDIHLADGSAFEIFEHVKINCPIIFTTAYDEYALRAFKVNSIAYLLKPIGENDLKQAIDKLMTWYESAPIPALSQSDQQFNGRNFEMLIRTLQKQANYKTHFLIPCKGDKLLPLAVDVVQYFCIVNGITKAVVNEKESYIIPYVLDELADCLNPKQFFRINRQYMISRKAVQDIDLWFNNRLAINLKVPTEDKILVSKPRVSEFKAWFAGELNV